MDIFSFHKKDRNRCVVCLDVVPGGGYYTRVIDGPPQVSTAAEEGVVEANYCTTSEDNIMFSECIHFIKSVALDRLY